MTDVSRETEEDVTGNPDFKLEFGKKLADLPRKSDIEAILKNENIGGENIRNIVVFNFGDGGILANALEERYSNVTVYEERGPNADIIKENFPDLQVEMGVPDADDNTLYFTTNLQDFRGFLREGSNSIVVVKADYREEGLEGYVDKISIDRPTVFSNYYGLYVFASE